MQAYQADLSASLSTTPTPSFGVQTRRLATLNSRQVVLASDDQLHLVELALPPAHSASSGSSGSAVQLPMHATVSSISSSSSASSSSSSSRRASREVQSLSSCPSAASSSSSASAAHFVADVDAAGRATLREVDVRAAVPLDDVDFGQLGSSDAEVGAQAPLKRQRLAGAEDAEPRVAALRSVELPRPATSVGELGWCGVSLDPTSCSGSALPRAVVCRQLSRELYFFDGEANMTRCVYPSGYPTSVLLQPQSPSLAVLAENNVFTAWDERVGSGDACVSRTIAGDLPLYDIAAHPNGFLFAMVGGDRQVVVVDSRKWRSITRWPGATKFDGISVAFAQAAPELVIVAGLDHEVACGPWDRSSKKKQQRLERKGFRGDRRWLGLDHVAGSDRVIGFTESGHIYALENAHRMCGL